MSLAVGVAIRFFSERAGEGAPLPEPDIIAEEPVAPPAEEAAAPPEEIIPPEEITTPEAAVKRAFQVPGYSDEEILEVKPIYGDDGKIKYWSVKTPRGTVTVKAGEE